MTKKGYKGWPDSMLPEELPKSIINYYLIRFVKLNNISYDYAYIYIHNDTWYFDNSLNERKWKKFKE